MNIIATNHACGGLRGAQTYGRTRSSHSYVRISAHTTRYAQSSPTGGLFQHSHPVWLDNRTNVLYHSG
jgi:hypothetical protein